MLQSLSQQKWQGTWYCAVLELMGRLLGVSPLGDYDSPLQLLIYMTTIKPIARVLVRLPKWAPSLDNGRGIQVCDGTFCPCCGGSYLLVTTYGVSQETAMLLTSSLPLSDRAGRSVAEQRPKVKICWG